MKSVLDHDKLCLAEPRHGQPKEIFRFTVNCLEQRLRALPDGAEISGVGERVDSPRKVWPRARVIGYDLLMALAERARSSSGFKCIFSRSLGNLEYLTYDNPLRL